MICVSIAQRSQRLAVFDMFNAGQACDLIELRLDRFESAPDVKTLLEKRFKPVIVACRRPADGGDWEGTEDARLALLRAAVLEKADYVEIEVDVATQIRRYGGTKRVITYTNTRVAPDDLAEIYRECCGHDPDVVKLTLPARTPDEAWPMIKILAKSNVPTVAVAWGRSARMLSILGRRYKAPWVYAALEKGMEAYPGMATIHELDELYALREIDSKTPLLGVAGTFEDQKFAARVLNTGFRAAGQKTRCLPVEMGDVPLFAKVVGAIRLEGILVDEQHRHGILKVLTEREDAVEAAGACDFVAIKDDKWKGFAALPRAVVGAIEDAMRRRRPDEPPIEGKTYLLVGGSGTARGIAEQLRRRGAAVVVADADNERAQAMAQAIGGRYIPNGQVYSAIADGVVLTRAPGSRAMGVAAIPMPGSAVREGMLAVDLTFAPYLTPFLDEVRVRNGLVVHPLDVFLRTMQIVLRAYTGDSIPLEQLRASLDHLDIDFDEVRAPTGN